MATLRRFEDLEIWREARNLSKEIIEFTRNTDLKSDFRLRGQIKSSSGSVMDNITEGFERDGNVEFRQFYRLPKDQQEKQGVNFIEFMTMVIYQIRK